MKHGVVVDSDNGWVHKRYSLVKGSLDTFMCKVKEQQVERLVEFILDDFVIGIGIMDKCGLGSKFCICGAMLYGSETWSMTVNLGIIGWGGKICGW